MKSLGGVFDYSTGYDPRFAELDRLLAQETAMGIEDDDQEFDAEIMVPRIPHQRMQIADDRPVTDLQRERILELRAKLFSIEEIAVEVGCQRRQVQTVFRQTARQERYQAGKSAGLAPPRRKRSYAAGADAIVEYRGERRSVLDWALNVIGIEPFEVRAFLASGKTPEDAVREALSKRKEKGRAA